MTGKRLHLDVDKNDNELYHAEKYELTRVAYHEVPRELTFPTEEDMACEAQLSALGTFEPLNFKIKSKDWYNDEEAIKEYWTPFQPKEGISNDRESVLIYGAEGSHPSDPCGLSQLQRKYGVKPEESSMRVPTEAKDKLKSMSHIFDYFDFARTFMVRLNAGGHYPPHRDHMLLSRPTFRLIGFFGDNICEPLRWEVEDQMVHFEPNTFYYVDTRKTHRLWSSDHNSNMIVCNVMKDWENVMKLLSVLRYQ